MSKKWNLQSDARIHIPLVHSLPPTPSIHPSDEGGWGRRNIKSWIFRRRLIKRDTSMAQRSLASDLLACELQYFRFYPMLCRGKNSCKCRSGDTGDNNGNNFYATSKQDAHCNYSIQFLHFFSSIAEEGNTYLLSWCSTFGMHLFLRFFLLYSCWYSTLGRKNKGKPDSNESKGDMDGVQSVSSASHGAGVMEELSTWIQWNTFFIYSRGASANAAVRGFSVYESSSAGAFKIWRRWWWKTGWRH